MNTGIRIVTVLAMATLPWLSGCTTLDPYTREEKMGNATKGAAIGAAAGVAAGLITSTLILQMINSGWK